MSKQRHSRFPISAFAFLMVGPMFLFDGSTAEAARFNSRQAETLPSPAVAQPSSAIVDFLATSESAARDVCCLPICYRSWARNRCFRCSSFDKITLLVEDPACCGCLAKVPVCLPSCCHGEPHVCSRCGILGRRRVSYTWKCGFAVEVVFRARGDLLVLY